MNMAGGKDFQEADKRAPLHPFNPFTKGFAKVANQALSEWKVPAISIAVIDNLDVFAEGFGNAVLPDEPANPTTVFYGGSTAKAFTASLLSHLIHSKGHNCLAGGWATPISSILHDDFVLQDDWATRHLTLEDAATHRTGMPRHDRASVREVDGRKATARDVVRNMRNLPLKVEPRTKFVYCNAMYVVLSHVIETVTGKGLGDVLREEIWEPLGMESTYFDLDHARKSADFAKGYFWDEGTGEYRPVSDMEVDELSGAGAILSTAADYAKWIKCLLHEEAPFSKETHRDIKTMRMMGLMPMGAYDVNLYGLGWQRTMYKGHPLYHHSGGLHAFGAQVYWFPERKLGVVGFGNTMMSSNAALEILAYKVIDDKLQIPEPERFDFAAMWKGMLSMMRRGADGAVDKLYPSKPNPSLPSSLKTEDLVGTYTDPGYGTFTLREEPRPDKPDETILVADRPEMTWKYKLEMHHVTGEYWIVYNKHLEVPNPMLEEYSSLEVKIGHDGRCKSLDIHWMNRMGAPVDAGILSFKKIS